VLLAPLRSGQTVRASYQLPTERRGVVEVGPLDVEVSDPFGVATMRTRAAGVTRLTVWPAVDDITPLPHTQGDEPHGASTTRTHCGPRARTSTRCGRTSSATTSAASTGPRRHGGTS
jgi:uncharacterized protein (DUF58 family)